MRRAARISAQPWPRGLGVVLIGALALSACGEVGDLAEGEGGVHPRAWAEARGHAMALRQGAFTLAECEACHAEEDDGPGACKACHEAPEGPRACMTCHAEEAAALPDRHPTHAAFDCVTCHEVPSAVEDEGHVADRGAGDVRFSGLAVVRGFTPTYDPVSGCANTACHAGTEAARPSPLWRDPAPMRCGDCHAVPPSGHPNDRCDRCHAATLTAEGALLPDGAHFNGVLEAEPWLEMACGACHGEGDDPAPPRALSGATDPKDPGVGAHQIHLHPTASAPVPCEACHVVPAVVNAPGHLDDQTPGAEVIFSGRALRADGVAATYTHGICANTACHGADTPSWTGDAPCGSCHGAPPVDHPRQACQRCHTTAGPDATIALPLQHGDGRSDLADFGPEDCDLCHGEGGRAAPVGSHAAHQRFECAACHVVPTQVLDEGHLDGAASTGRVVTCAESRCHGVGAPTWGLPETVQGCEACHSAPPPQHASGDCVNCHPDPSDDPRHVNGQLDLTFDPACDGCHGAPPETGAHVAHMNAGAITAALRCQTCHVVPEAVEDEGHLDPDPVEVVLARGRFEAGGCVETGCHHGRGGAVPAPQWLGGPEAGACDGCHGDPPPGHPNWECDNCHGAVVDAARRIIAPELHINGVVEVQ